MKKFLSSLFCLIASLVFVCSGTILRENKDVSLIPEKKAEGKDTSNSAISQDIENEIKNLVSTKVKAVQQKDIERYLSTVNAFDKEFYSEQKHWFQDIIVNEIKEYSLRVTRIEKKTDEHYLVSMHQQYVYGEETKELKYTSIYQRIDEKLLDSDLDFRSKETEHFTIKYSRKNDKLADSFAKAAEEAYLIVANNYGKAPLDKTTIKIYDDVDTLRQFIKLSFQWDMAGWYEYSESIKFIGRESEAHPQSLAHELIHKITIGDSNNNMPYWFSEGLATHYSGDSIQNHTSRKYMSIEQLENTDLERLTDYIDIISYYGSAQDAVEYIIYKYGEESIGKLIAELSRFPFEDKTGSEVDKKNIKIFNDVSKKVLGVSTTELDNINSKDKTS